jgi:hypothetical protein
MGECWLPEAQPLVQVGLTPALAHEMGERWSARIGDHTPVMRAQRDLVKIVRRLRPVLVYKSA